MVLEKVVQFPYDEFFFSFVLGVGHTKEVVDEETESWPVPPELRTDLDALKFEFQVAPLHVFKSGEFVEPQAVNGMLENALVDIHFALRHYFFREKKEDSFNASIEQITILQLGTPLPMSPYKRKDF